MDCVVCSVPIVLEPDMQVCQGCRQAAHLLDPLDMFRPKENP